MGNHHSSRYAPIESGESFARHAVLRWKWTGSDWSDIALRSDRSAREIEREDLQRNQLNLITGRYYAAVTARSSAPGRVDLYPQHLLSAVHTYFERLTLRADAPEVEVAQHSRCSLQSLIDGGGIVCKLQRVIFREAVFDMKAVSRHFCLTFRH